MEKVTYTKHYISSKKDSPLIFDEDKRQFVPVQSLLSEADEIIAEDLLHSISRFTGIEKEAIFHHFQKDYPESSLNAVFRMKRIAPVCESRSSTNLTIPPVASFDANSLTHVPKWFVTVLLTRIPLSERIYIKNKHISFLRFKTWTLSGPWKIDPAKIWSSYSKSSMPDVVMEISVESNPICFLFGDEHIVHVIPTKKIFRQSDERLLADIHGPVLARRKTCIKFNYIPNPIIHPEHAFILADILTSGDQCEYILTNEILTPLESKKGLSFYFLGMKFNVAKSKLIDEGYNINCCTTFDNTLDFEYVSCFIETLVTEYIGRRESIKNDYQTSLNISIKSDCQEPTTKLLIKSLMKLEPELFKRNFYAQDCPFNRQPYILDSETLEDAYEEFLVKFEDRKGIDPKTMVKRFDISPRIFACIPRLMKNGRTYSNDDPFPIAFQKYQRRRIPENTVFLNTNLEAVPRFVRWVICCASQRKGSNTSTGYVMAYEKPLEKDKQGQIPPIMKLFLGNIVSIRKGLGVFTDTVNFILTTDGMPEKRRAARLAKLERLYATQPMVVPFNYLSWIVCKNILFLERISFYNTQTLTPTFEPLVKKLRYEKSIFLTCNGETFEIITIDGLIYHTDQSPLTKFYKTSLRCFFSETFQISTGKKPTI